MKFSHIAAAAALSAATVSGTQVACRVNGVQGTVVDLETGLCEFEIPSALPVNFNFVAIDNYEVDAYYAIVDNAKVFNDIAKAGRTLQIAAKVLYEVGDFPLYHIHAAEKSSANSTEALHARFNKNLVKRHPISDLVAKIKAMPGVETPKFSLMVNTPDVPSASKSSSVSAAPTQSTKTETNTKTTLITITSCSDHKCSEKVVPATEGPMTATIDGTATVYTTWCPITAEETSTTTKAMTTTTVTVTHCSDNKCSETVVPATMGATTVTSAGSTTVYTTWCPITAEETSTTTKAITSTTVTVTHCSDNKCSETVVPATMGPTTVTSAGSTTVYTTWCPVTTTKTEPVPTVGTHPTTVVTSVSPVTSSTAPASVKFNNSGYKVGASLFMLALPLAYIF